MCVIPAALQHSQAVRRKQVTIKKRITATLLIAAVHTLLRSPARGRCDPLWRARSVHATYQRTTKKLPVKLRNRASCVGAQGWGALIHHTSYR